MEIKIIQELIRLINKSNIGELRIEEKDFKITIRSKDYPGSKAPSLQTSLPASYGADQYNQGMGTQTVGVAAPAAEANIPVATAASPKSDEKFHIIKSPMVGTFYRSSSPDKDPFVKVGDRVEPGAPICIIEAMKLFNEIESEISGKIVKVLVENASPVEYDQPLFQVEIN